MRALLIRLFPPFSADCTDDEWAGREREGTATFHAVMQAFAPFFGAARTTFSEPQLRGLGELLDDAVARHDELENAVSTCFLEHLHQIRGYKVLARHLSAAARGRTRA